MCQSARSLRGAQDGFVLLAVLFVLLALLVLCAPFLATARNADRASGQLADRAQARLGLDAAGRHARLTLGRSHPGAPDPTPWWDDLDEIYVDNDFDPAFLDADDPHGLMWDLDVHDVAGRIDLSSANPMVLANAMGMVARATEVIEADATEIPASLGEGFDPDGGFLWIRGEIVHYEGTGQGRYSPVTRGVGTTWGEEDGEWLTEGPRPPTGHGIGTHILDQRALAPVIWRNAGVDDEPRQFDTFEQLAESDIFALAGSIGERARASLAGLCSTYGGVRAGGRWQRPLRLTSHVEGGETRTLTVDDPRYVNAGATLWIGDEDKSELRLVQRVTRRGQIRLEYELNEDYDAWTTTVKILRKRPVNLNTAPRPVLEALFLNLQLAGHNSRITAREARNLAKLVLDSRPFTGLEDWMRRVVLPSAGIEELPSEAPVVPEALAVVGGGVIDPADALALYLNGLNANDRLLEYSTMPFTFLSRDTYELDLRATVNARSGIERARVTRERVEAVVPQRMLFTMWSSQEAFDESLRLSRAAAWWSTGPQATTRYDGGTTPPSHAWPHLGTLDGRFYLPGYHQVQEDQDGEPRSPEHVFPSREDDSWAQLWCARVEEAGAREGRVLHFDHETRDPEGRYLPEQVVQRMTDDRKVLWASESEGGLMRALSLSLWVKPTALMDGLLLDVAGLSEESDRVTLGLEGEDLVLRVLDGFGDHRDTPGFVEATEVRCAIAAAGEEPGLPVDTWSHVELDVAGTRPDQVDLRLNGLAHGVRRLGITRLIRGASQGESLLEVESLEGFPPQGVARVGNELVEYVIEDGALLCRHLEAGRDAGFGGRLARTRWTADGVPAYLDGITTSHAADTPVVVYGYSAPLASNVPGGTGEKTLGAEIGNFRVARVIGMDGRPDPIQAGLFYFGIGYEATNTSGLILAPADDPEGDGEVMSAFHPDGGYALLLQQRWRGDRTGRSSTPPNAPLGGFEIIRYSGYDDTTLFIDARGDAVAAELPRYAALDPDELGGGSRVFVLDWEGTSTNNGKTLVQDVMRYGTYVLPISVSVPEATLLDFLPPAEDNSEFAQITRSDQGELTEWVRYDTVQEQRGQLVRDHEDALTSAYAMLVGSLRPDDDLDGRELPDGGGGGGGGGGAPPLGSIGTTPPEPPLSAATSSPPSAPPPAQGGVNWIPERGRTELEDWPLSRAVSSVFQFRGVLETHDHAHPAGTPVLPVIQLHDRGVEGGRAGARDAVFLSGPEGDHLGWPMVVHRANLPALGYTVYYWEQVEGEPRVVATASNVAQHGGFRTGRQYVALDRASPEPIAVEIGTNISDPRLRARLVKHPSGERPRAVTTVSIGGAARGGAGVPAAVVDEVIFGAPGFLNGLPGTGPASHSQGASMWLAEAIDAETDILRVHPRSFRVPEGMLVGPEEVLDWLPEDAGILRIGEELLCYDSRDPLTGDFTIAAGGRGVLGTLPQPHDLSEPVAFVEHIVVTVLDGALGEGDSTLRVASLEGFPSQGLVLVGEELVHFTRHRSGALDMPRLASRPGAADEGGPGLLRGRFGTAPAEHAAGAPVILFPFRYWDRWSAQADVPELAYLGLEFDQPGAWWSSVFWDAETAPHGQCKIGVLQRTDPGVPWDEDPDLTDGLTLYWEGREQDEMIPVGGMSDRIEWRVFVHFEPGAFDPSTGLSHGWKETPRLRRLGLEFLAPSLVCRSVDR